MSKKRNMPTRKSILIHWQDILWDAPDKVNLCWACGFERRTQRCHVVAKADGGKDTVENLLLLCSDCHKLQERACMDVDTRQRFVSEIIEGAPFMQLRIYTIATSLMLT